MERQLKFKTQNAVQLSVTYNSLMFIVYEWLQSPMLPDVYIFFEPRL